VHAADHRQTHAQVQNPDYQQNEHGPHDGKFDCRRTAFVAAYIMMKSAHRYCNRIIPVLTIGVVNAPATVTPGNIGA
jgi:hypothetical protein